MREPLRIPLDSCESAAGLRLRELRVSAACALLHAVSNGLSASTSKRESDLASLRDQLCGITDRLNSVDLRRPLILVVECGNEGDYDDWHGIAGNQDWHRGGFSITPYLPSAFNATQLETVDALIAQLSAETMSGSSATVLEELTGASFGNLVRARMADSEWLSTLDADTELPLYRSFGNYICAELGPDGDVQRGFVRWLTAVKQFATRATDTGPKPRNTNIVINTTSRAAALPDNPAFWQRAAARWRAMQASA